MSTISRLFDRCLYSKPVSSHKKQALPNLAIHNKTGTGTGTGTGRGKGNREQGRCKGNREHRTGKGNRKKEQGTGTGLDWRN
jgi:hypothetical protein